MNGSHDPSGHPIAGSPHEQMRALLARHLCGWLSGHTAPDGHFLVGADLLLNEAHLHGIRFHFAGVTESAVDGFCSVSVTARG